MTTISFNPLEYSKKLQEVGMSIEQSEMLAQLQIEIISNAGNEPVTKKDLLLAKNDIILKLGSLMVVLIGVLGFLLKH